MITSVGEPSDDHNLEITDVQSSSNFWVLIAEMETRMAFGLHGMFFNNINRDPRWFVKDDGRILLHDVVGRELKEQDRVFDVRVMPEKVGKF